MTHRNMCAGCGPSPRGCAGPTKDVTMTLLGKDLYRALALGFVLGCAGMAMNTTGLITRAQAATSHIPLISHVSGPHATKA